MLSPSIERQRNNEGLFKKKNEEDKEYSKNTESQASESRQTE